jgi:nicotinamide-nucleotide amidase
VDVPAELIEKKGAVRGEVSSALAEGIRQRSGATLGLAVTGVAGPAGGSSEKPGTVHIALADAKTTKDREFHFPGDREKIRFQASQMALELVRRFFLYAAPPKG